MTKVEIQRNKWTVDTSYKGTKTIICFDSNSEVLPYVMTSEILETYFEQKKTQNLKAVRIITYNNFGPKYDMIIQKEQNKPFCMLVDRQRSSRKMEPKIDPKSSISFHFSSF